LTARVLLYGVDGELRPLWRIALFASITSAAFFVVRFAALTITPAASDRTRVIALQWCAVIALAVGHIVMLRWLDPRTAPIAGTGGAAVHPAHIALGALLGILAILLPVTLLLEIGWVRFTPAPAGNGWAALTALLLLLVPAALAEELLVRGYLFALLRRAWGAGGALFATSFAFGVLHIRNAGATPASVLVVMLAGAFLGAVLIVTGSLYAAFAAHLAWNVTLAGGPHAIVSGITFDAPNFRLVETGPDWVTGGAWGPEGGLAAVLGLAGGLSYLYARRPGQRGAGNNA
jgi:membrane protease YdiL (CAAX protease family)